MSAATKRAGTRHTPATARIQARLSVASYNTFASCAQSKQNRLSGFSARFGTPKTAPRCGSAGTSV